MFSLPSLMPQDSHTLWYTSTSTPSLPQSDPNHLAPTNSSNSYSPSPNNSHRLRAHHRTPLARLRLDEEYITRRKINVSNYGSSWIKPPGIPKSLYQLREEKREMEEHAETMRREQLAQELAEAEAADVGGEEGLDEMGETVEGEEGELERDLDDDVPEADTTQLSSQSDPDSEIEQEDAEHVPAGVLASRMPDDVYREALIRGEAARRAGLGSGSTTDGEEDHSHMLQEDDLVHEAEPEGMDMDMEANLDDEIPEAESVGGYEHTDTEDELLSSEEESEDEMPALRGGMTGAAATSMVRSDGTQNSMDLESLLERSSQVESSPQVRGGFEARRRSRQ